MEGGWILLQRPGSWRHSPKDTAMLGLWPPLCAGIYMEHQIFASQSAKEIKRIVALGYFRGRMSDLLELHLDLKHCKRYILLCF